LHTCHERTRYSRTTNELEVSALYCDHVVAVWVVASPHCLPYCIAVSCIISIPGKLCSVLFQGDCTRMLRYSHPLGDSVSHKCASVFSLGTWETHGVFGFSFILIFGFGASELNLVVHNFELHASLPHNRLPPPHPNPFSRLARA
jgi:hypothetical protein